jgi:cytochrome c
MDGMKNFFAPLLCAALSAVAPQAHADGDAAAGKLLYGERCSSCHSLQYNGVGPAHKDLIGRRAGTAQGYSYSAALKASTVVWNEETLSRWLAAPEQFIPGQKMFFSVPDARQRADIVAYLLMAARQQPSTPRKPGE